MIFLCDSCKYSNKLFKIIQISGATDIIVVSEFFYAIEKCVLLHKKRSALDFTPAETGMSLTRPAGGGTFHA